MTDSRWTRVGRHSYNTTSHKARPVRTPGGQLKGQFLKKKCKGPRCSDCKLALAGIKQMSLKNTKKRERTVSRAYGGSMCATCLRQRIIRAFLLEEQKAVKKVLAERKK